MCCIVYAKSDTKIDYRYIEHSSHFLDNDLDLPVGSVDGSLKTAKWKSL